MIEEDYEREEEHQIELHNRLDVIAEKIKNWDHESIYELSDLISQFRVNQGLLWDGVDQLLERGINMNSLPSEPIPDDIDIDPSYKIWAMDKHRNCLVGETASEIKSILDIQDDLIEEDDDRQME